ncbi:MAG: septum formation protein Maf [Anaerolineaceae bacterium]|nr:septum formation protein Maf [Anaerolineaceae bacterium]MBN2678232.1 septum formation protein Maf [Anaerolineaceae bacterium]
MARVILASSSARRRDLIKLTDWEVSLMSPDIDESRRSGEKAREYVMRLAREKAAQILSSVDTDYILTADTIVVDRETVYGKPEDENDARRMLKELCAHTHQVMTAIVLVNVAKWNSISDLCESSVTMRSFSAFEIESYLASGDAMDKAGAYAIQNREFHPVEVFSGCFASVMGMPLCHLKRSASKLGLTIRDGLVERCQTMLDYHCPIHEAVLRGDIIG